MRTKPQRGSRRYRKNSKRIKKQRRNASRQLSQGFSIARKLRSIIPSESIFNDFRLHGNTKWRPSELVMLSPARALVELHWSIAAMAASGLLATKEQFRLHNRKSYDSRSRWTPRRRSLAQTMRAIRRAIHQPEAIPKFGYDLTSMLQGAVTDGYKRRVSRKARYRPRPNKTLLKPPLVAKLKENERRNIEKIRMQIDS